jgi:IPTL-CTERM motif
MIMKIVTTFIGIVLFSLLVLGINDAKSQGICPVNGQVIAGQLNASGPSQMGRIFRDAIPSSCPSKAYPGIFNPGETYSYEVHEFFQADSTSCVTVNFNPNPGTANDCMTNAHASAYLNSYDPTNQALNYVGDVGSSVTQPFSFTVPAGDRLVLAVTNTAAQATCNYSFSVLAYPCGAIVKIALAPETASLTSGVPHTVTATVKANGQPLAGQLVTFNVTSGPDTGRESQPGSGECSPVDCRTDANGQVSWTFTSLTRGIDTVTASVESNTMTVLSDPVEVMWLGLPIPTLSEWGLISMAALAGIIGLVALRRKKAAA